MGTVIVLERAVGFDRTVIIHGKNRAYFVSRFFLSKLNRKTCYHTDMPIPFILIILNIPRSFLFTSYSPICIVSYGDSLPSYWTISMKSHLNSSGPRMSKPSTEQMSSSSRDSHRDTGTQSWLMYPPQRAPRLS
jgi:hypothetical protein